MDIRIKEPLYIVQQGQEYTVRPGTVGVERNRVVFFYDVTRTAAVGFSRDFCLENPQTFQVSRTLEDKELSFKDVARVIENFPALEKPALDALMSIIKTL